MDQRFNLWVKKLESKKTLLIIFLYDKKKLIIDKKN